MGILHSSKQRVFFMYSFPFLQTLCRFVLLLCIGLMAGVAPAHADSIGTWTPHLAYHNATQSIAVGNKVYALFGENFLSYNGTDTEVRRYAKSDGMAGKAVMQIGYSATAGRVVLVYTNGMVDVFDPETETFIALNYLADNLSTTGAPTALDVSGDYATLTTANGVVVFNVKRLEMRGYYPRAVAALTGAVNEGVLYVATATNIVAGKLTDNLNDNTRWTTVATLSATRLVPFGGRLYVLTKDNGLWQLSGASGAILSTLQQISTTSYTKATVNGATATLCSPSEVAVYSSTATTKPATVFAWNNAWNDVARTADGTLYAAEAGKGLVGYATSGTTLKPSGAVIGGYGPIRDLGGYLSFVGNRLLVAGGPFEAYFSMRSPGTAMYLENNKWTYFDEVYSIYPSFTSIVQDPLDATHHYVTSGEQGFFEYRNGKFVLRLADHGGMFVKKEDRIRMNAAKYDASGNLWVLNMLADTTICILQPNGKWTKLFVPNLSNYRYLHSTLFDAKGRLWLASRVWHGTATGGVHCIDFGGTINDRNDDKTLFRATMTNTDGTAVDLQTGVYSMAQDFSGHIWLGGVDGVYVIDNPDAFMNEGFQVVQPKVARNDGTNLADYLLSGATVTAIAVDGANRKWFGTNTGGVYLTNATGTEILKHFTVDNSPLLSNNIYSIAPNLETGEVFFGTEAGIISYQSDATRAYETLEKSNIKIFPNPVAPRQSQVAITGLTDQAAVKIMTTSGFAVASGTSSGGSFMWNLRGPNGKRVASGVYYVLMATSDGSTSVVGKVVVI